MTIRICIADRQPRVRYGLRVLLEQQPGWVVSGEVANAKELLENVQADCPDIILLDWELLGAPGRDLLDELRIFCPNLFIVSLSAHPEAQVDALRAGADGLASKIEPPEKLISLIHSCTRARHEVDSR